MHFATRRFSNFGANMNLPRGRQQLALGSMRRLRRTADGRHGSVANCPNWLLYTLCCVFWRTPSFKMEKAHELFVPSASRACWSAAWWMTQGAPCIVSWHWPSADHGVPSAVLHGALYALMLNILNNASLLQQTWISLVNAILPSSAWSCQTWP